MLGAIAHTGLYALDFAQGVLHTSHLMGNIRQLVEQNSPAWLMVERDNRLVKKMIIGSIKLTIEFSDEAVIACMDKGSLPFSQERGDHTLLTHYILFVHKAHRIGFPGKQT